MFENIPFASALLEQTLAHVVGEAIPTADLYDSLAFFDRLWGSDLLPPPRSSELEQALGAEDVFSGTQEETYLLDLYDTQIPTMRANIDTALHELDPVRDKKIIKELKTLDNALAEIRTNIGWGNLTAHEAYTEVTDALHEMRDKVFTEIRTASTTHSEGGSLAVG